MPNEAARSRRGVQPNTPTFNHTGYPGDATTTEILLLHYVQAQNDMLYNEVDRRSRVVV